MSLFYQGSTEKGKVLVTVENLGAYIPHFYIHILKGYSDSLHESLDAFLACNIQQLLSRSHKRLPDGAKVTLAFACSASYSRDYWGEYDCDVEVGRVKTLRVVVPGSRSLRRMIFDSRHHK